MIIDTHCHVIATDTKKYPLKPLFGKQSDWSAEHPLDYPDMVKADEAAGVAKAVLVQASSAYGSDNSYVSDSVAAHPERFTGVFSIDVVAPDAVAKMKHWMGKGLTGMRIFTSGSTHAEQETFFAEEAAYPVWQYASDQGLSVCMQMRVVGLPLLETVIKRFPKVRILLDHFARAEAADGAPFPSAAPLWALSKYPNVYLKLTHRPIEQSVKGKSTPQAFLGKAIAEFGAQRMCWGSNFPAAKPPLPELITMARKALDFLPQQDQDQIFYKTALALYPALNKKIGSHAVLTRPDKVKLHTLLGSYPNAVAMKDGRVKSDLVEFDFPDFPVPNRGFKPMVRDHKFDCGELAIVTFLQAREYGLPYVLLPATVVGRGQLHTVAYNSERGTMKPSDLNGKKFGVRSYTQTTGIWVRGILAESFGVDWSKVEITTMEDPHVAQYKDPSFVKRAPETKQLPQMLIDGELDAALIGDKFSDPRFKTLVPDAEAANKDWAMKHGGVPINHMVIVREKIAKERPDVVEEIFRCVKAARDLDTTAPKGALDPYRFGVEANRAALERVIDYSLKQQMITKKPKVDDLFDDFTRKLGA